ncbi:CCA tRNA nucleotidyltransferase [Pseudogemmobacter sonorensis]|uniref:CCA tRNA nucleotidyltransferase n=1 Tax=Pseudogemmobacter sonorensis TaxID=2989681 RepID=UPI0036BC70DB
MKIAGDWLARAGTQSVLSLLTGAGHRAYVVGGCVRNALLGQPVADIDISTDARPERVMALARAAGLRAVPTGVEHGTVTVIAGGAPHEVTTFRRDVETDGRRASVVFSDRIEEDALRRDLTMNALYATADGTVVDPLGGLADTLARRVRFVGRAEDRIREDHLRILRFFRFLAWYGDPAEGPDPEGLAACAALAEGIDRLSRERVGAEMRKLLAAPDPAPAVAAMAAAGVLARALPGADARALPVLVHLEAALGPQDAPDWRGRLAVLGGEDTAARLRLSRAEAAALAAIRRGIGDGAAPAELGWRDGIQGATAAILARAALTGTPPPEGWQAEIRRGASAVFPLRAADLPGLSGPALGAALKRLETAWLADGLRPGKAELLGTDFLPPENPL